MTNSNDKSGSPLHPSKTPQQHHIESFFKTLDSRLYSIEEDLHKVLSCYHFLNDSMRIVMAHSENPLPEATHPWHFGLYSISDWLEDLSASLMRDVKEMNEWSMDRMSECCGAQDVQERPLNRQRSSLCNQQ